MLLLTNLSSALAMIARAFYSSASHAILIAPQHSIFPSILVSQNSCLLAYHSSRLIRLEYLLVRLIPSPTNYSGIILKNVVYLWLTFKGWSILMNWEYYY